MVKNSLVVLGLLFLTTANEAMACGAGIKFSPALLSSINLNGNTTQTQPVPVTRSNGKNGNETCKFFITIDNDIYPTYSQRALTFGQIPYPIQFFTTPYPGPVVLKHITEASSAADVVSGEFASPGNADATVYYHFHVDPGYNTRAGSYNGNYKIRLYKGQFGQNPELMDEKSINFVFTEQVAADLSLVDTGAPFDYADTTQSINFGELSTGEQGSFDLLIKYNEGYDLSIKSENSGQIKNTVSGSLLPYTFNFNGNNISLTNTFQVKSTAPKGEISPNTGIRFPITVTMGNVTGASPGTYTDTVSFQILSKY